MTPQKKVRLALAGCGRRGICVAGLFRNHPQCEITALMDPFESATSLAATQLDIPEARVYRNFELMLKDAPVDAIFLACDPTQQVGLACAAMKAGKHVCTEVPAAFTIAECWDLVETVKKTGCKYQLLEQLRYCGFIETWMQMNERGELGHICLAQGEYVHFEMAWKLWMDKDTGEMIGEIPKPSGRRVEPTWRRRILADPIYYLPHTLSPILRVLDDRVVRVSCMGTRKHSYTHPDVKLPWSDIQYALMHTAKDTVVLAGAGFSLPHVPRGELGAHWYDFRGTRGSVESPRSKADTYRAWRRGMDAFETSNVSSIPIGATEEEQKTGHGGTDFKPVDTFIRAIVDDTVPPMDVYRSVETAAPAILAAESANQGGALLEVPNFRTEKRRSKSKAKIRIPR